jgi:hypothetical protein
MLGYWGNKYLNQRHARYVACIDVMDRHWLKTGQGTPSRGLARQQSLAIPSRSPRGSGHAYSFLRGLF